MMSEIEEAVATTPEISVKEEQDEQVTTDKPKLNHKNYLNLIAYILNITLVYGVGNAGWLGTPDNGELSLKYQTLVTPAGQAFLIWSIIFLSQGAFAVLQFLPRFRAHPMVQEGLSYWYIAVTATQIGWTFAFAFEVIPASLTCMILIWISLIGILYKQYYTESDGSILEFVVLRFPFQIHAGWITAASALNVNVQVVSMDQPADIQLAVSIVSLAVLHAVSVWVLFNIPRPQWTIACVLSWAFGWIYVELGNNVEKITNKFDEDIISGVRYAAISVCFIILIQLVFRLLLLVLPSWNPYKKVSDEEETAEGAVLDEEQV
jgi:hypothetical protein